MPNSFKAGHDGSFSTGFELSNVFHRACACIVLQTVQRPAIYGTVHYKHDKKLTIIR